MSGCIKMNNNTCKLEYIDVQTGTLVLAGRENDYRSNNLGNNNWLNFPGFESTVSASGTVSCRWPKLDRVLQVVPVGWH